MKYIKFISLIYLLIPGIIILYELFSPLYLWKIPSLTISLLFLIPSIGVIRQKRWGYNVMGGLAFIAGLYLLFSNIYPRSPLSLVPVLVNFWLAYLIYRHRLFTLSDRWQKTVAKIKLTNLFPHFVGGALIFIIIIGIWQYSLYDSLRSNPFSCDIYTKCPLSTACRSIYPQQKNGYCKMSWLPSFTIKYPVVIASKAVERYPRMTPSPTPTPRLTQDLSRVLYPPDKSTIADTNPTISFKLTQLNHIYLPYAYGLEPSVFAPDTKSLYLTFKHGFLNDIEVRVDNRNQDHIFGIPQFPQVFCAEETEARNNPEISRSTGEKICRDKNSQNIPPLIVFVNPTTSLAAGLHHLTISSGNSVLLDSTFTVDPAYKDTSSPVNPVWMNNFSRNDNCGNGYHFSKQYQPIPIIRGERQYYRLAFPQAPNQKYGRGQIVWLGYSGQRYHLNLPPEKSFFFPYEMDSYFISQSALYIHEELLVDQAGNPLTMWRPCTDCYPEGEYFEFIPMDISGNLFRDRFIWWQTSDSSACDG